MPLLRPLAAAALAVAAIALSACSATADSAAPEATTAASATPAASQPSATAEPDTVAPAADPTCETIIPASTVDAFEGIGWSAQEQPFTIGATELSDGILCVWADFEGPAGDHLQLFGWAPIEPDAAEAAQDELISQGWLREEDANGVYITEDPLTAIVTDDDGYGLTYLFADDSVTYADTKQGLLLIEWPPAG